MLGLSSLGSLPDLALRPSQGTAPGGANPRGGDDFASLLGKLAGDTAATVQAGEAAALGGIQGSLPLQTVVEKVMAAERTLQAALAVRDKTVSAYLEISRMQI